MKKIKYRIGLVLFLATISLGSLKPARAVLSQASKKPNRSEKKSQWQARLHRDLQELEKLYPGKIGLYIKDLSTGEEFSLHADESWYLASTIKVPVAMEVLRQVDAKKISLDQKIIIINEDYVDGAGPLKRMKPGEEVSIRFLIEQMIIWSDNMATDMLLRTVGPEKVNELVKAISPESFSSITSLKEVRRHIYGELHEKAFSLQGDALIKLRAIPNPKERIAEFAELIKVDRKLLSPKSIHEAYQEYYRKGLNSASAKSYSKILEALWEGEILSAPSREFLIRTMVRTQTGKNRIRGGLAAPWIFAHKTGTQYQRIGDVGFLMNTREKNRKPLVVVSFVRDVKNLSRSTRILKEIAKTISSSGVL